MKVIALILLVVSNFCVSAQETPDESIPNVEKEIMSIVDKLFDGMRAGDSTLVHSVFYDNVDFRTTYLSRRTNELVMEREDLLEFLNAIGTPHEEIWDERISNVIVHIDANLAEVWMDYSFYAGNTFSHCGVNSIQLIRLTEGWKISAITDTRRAQPCP